jgi:hypothetical protein
VDVASLAYVSEALAAFIFKTSKMDAARTSEMSPMRPTSSSCKAPGPGFSLKDIAAAEIDIILTSILDRDHA